MNISIVVPLYNKERYIDATLRSIDAQSHRAFEVIVVDDGSTDRSVDMVRPYLARPNYRLLSQNNCGVSSARNLGISHARYDFVAFLDADDTWYPGFLSEIARLIGKYPNCGLYATGWHFTYRGQRYCNQGGIEGDARILDYFSHSLRYTVVWTSAAVVWRAAINRVGGFPEGMISGEDLYLWAKIADCYPLAYSDAKLAHYNIDAGGALIRRRRTDPGPHSYADLITPGDDAKLEYLASQAYRKAIAYASWGAKREALRVLAPFAATNRWRKGIVKLCFYTPAWLLRLVLDYGSLCKHGIRALRGSFRR